MYFNSVAINIILSSFLLPPFRNKQAFSKKLGVLHQLYPFFHQCVWHVKLTSSFPSPLFCNNSTTAALFSQRTRKFPHFDSVV